MKSMKKEVKYGRMPCTVALFRFQKGHADLDSEKCADDLISYLDAKSIKQITLADLNVLHGLTKTPLFKNNIENTKGFVFGECIAAFWLEDNL